MIPHFQWARFEPGRNSRVKLSRLTAISTIGTSRSKSSQLNKDFLNSTQYVAIIPQVGDLWADRFWGLGLDEELAVAFELALGDRQGRQLGVP
jgi:hypothetical protein